MAADNVESRDILLEKGCLNILIDRIQKSENK